MVSAISSIFFALLSIAVFFLNIEVLIACNLPTNFSWFNILIMFFVCLVKGYFYTAIYIYLKKHLVIFSMTRFLIWLFIIAVILPGLHMIISCQNDICLDRVLYLISNSIVLVIWGALLCFRLNNLTKY